MKMKAKGHWLMVAIIKKEERAFVSGGDS